MEDAHARRLERLYHDAAINRFVGPRLVVKEGEAIVTLDAKREFHHAMGAVHGSMIFKILDDAAFFAANSLVADAFVLTSNFHLHFLRPVAEGEMRAVGRVVHRGRRQLVADAEATDASGRVIARGTGTFVVSEFPIPKEG